MSNKDRTRYSEEQSKQIKPQKGSGLEADMNPRPLIEDDSAVAGQRLKNKVALITGGDSGIGRAVAVAFAKEGANVAIIYYESHQDAEETKKLVEEKGQTCLLINGDLKQEDFCVQAVEQTVKHFGRLNILVNNAAIQHSKRDIREITAAQLQDTFATNFFAYFYLSKAALSHLKKDDCIINTTSVVAYKGSTHLIDYAATKGAIVAFTRALSQSLVSKGIRVNGVAPGPVWTPLIPASFSEEEIQQFGKNVPMQRAAQPDEIAPCYVFLASQGASYITGQILHPNGGVIVNG